VDLEAFAAALADIEESLQGGTLTPAKYAELRDKARVVAGDEWDELAEAVENFSPE
jgi:trans-2-enoyl-CoA reductase